MGDNRNSLRCRKNVRVPKPRCRKACTKKNFDEVIGPPLEIFRDAEISDSDTFLHSRKKKFAQWTFLFTVEKNFCTVARILSTAANLASLCSSASRSFLVCTCRDAYTKKKKVVSESRRISVVTQSSVHKESVS